MLGAPTRSSHPPRLTSACARPCRATRRQTLHWRHGAPAKVEGGDDLLYHIADGLLGHDFAYSQFGKAQRPRAARSTGIRAWVPRLLRAACRQGVQAPSSFDAPSFIMKANPPLHGRMWMLAFDVP